MAKSTVSTTWTKSDPVNTIWGSENVSAGVLLLQSSGNLLLQNSSSLGLQ